VARALALEEGRALRRQAVIEFRAQLHAEPVRRGIQAQAPRHAQPVDCEAEAEQLRDLDEQVMAAQAVRGETVDHRADLARHEHGAQGHAEQHHRRRRVGTPVPADETADQPCQTH
ncbi:conserved hypothetical protein, partial [Ricinus communis]